jgi:hypothetical protein
MMNRSYVELGNNLHSTLFSVAVLCLHVLTGLSHAQSTLTPSGPVTIEGQNGRVIENLKITSTGDCVTIQNSSYITIRNSEIGPCNGNAIVIGGGNAIRIVDNYIHPDSRTPKPCCDRADGIMMRGTSNILIQGNVIAYGESNVVVMDTRSAQVIGNFLLNPQNSDSRSQNVLVSDNSKDTLIDGNYALASTNTCKYPFPESQEDSINLENTDGVTVRNNYISGGRSPSGCGVIAEYGANNTRILNNSLVDTGQCGIGVAGGLNQIIDGNQIINSTPVPDGGNTAIYVWWIDSTSAPCGGITITNNVASAIKPDGTTESGYWKGPGCDPVVLEANIFDQTARSLLTPAAQKLPPPLIPPRPYACVTNSPYSTQNAMNRCDGSLGSSSPSVVLTAPSNGQKVSGIVPVSAAAVSDGGVASIQFILDGTALAPLVVVPPYSVNWNTTLVPDGVHTLTCTIRDIAGHTASPPPVSVTVLNAVNAQSAIPMVGLKMWLRADAGVTLNNLGVANWFDQSGNNTNAVQPVSTMQPAWVNSRLNGKPVVHFDGLQSFLTFPLSIEGWSGMTIFLVSSNSVNGNLGNSRAEDAAIFWGETVWWGVVYLSPFQDVVAFRFGTTQPNNWPVYMRPASLGNTASITVSKKDGTTDSLYINGSLVMSEGGKFPSILGTQAVGILGAGDHGTYFTGDIAEVLIYNRALTDGERQSVEQYLTAQYLH